MERKASMRHGTPIGGGLRMAVYPIRPRQEEIKPGKKCTLCKRTYTKTNKPVLTTIGYATNSPAFVWECAECNDATAEYTLKFPGIVVEDTVNWRGDYWERTLHPSEGRFKRAFGQWVPEGYETEIEELQRQVATNALDQKFNAS